MPRTTTIKLGAKSYRITELPRNKNKAWLKSLKGLADNLMGQVQGISGEEITDWDSLKGKASGIIGSVVELVSTDTMLERMYDYSPELRAEAQEIEESDELYDSEIVDAFVGVLALATPFGGLWKQATSLLSRGANALQTGTNSQGPSGEPKA